jgi:hypothetical protein
MSDGLGPLPPSSIPLVTHTKAARAKDAKE